MSMCHDVHGGYVKCDICGDGYNTISVCNCTNDPGKVNYTRHSKCYGDVVLVGVTYKEALDQLKADWFLIATRDARASAKRLVRTLNRMILEAREKASPPPRESPQATRTARPRLQEVAQQMTNMTASLTAVGNAAHQAAENWSLITSYPADWYFSPAELGSRPYGQPRVIQEGNTA